MNNNPIKYVEIKLIENLLPLELFENYFIKIIK